MKFKSAYLNATYVVRPKVTMPHPVTGMPEVKQSPLRAKFLGGQSIFDSEATQKRMGWSDEERLAVERYLLTHRDFGRARHGGRGGLYLAPGESIPPEHADLIQTLEPDVVLEAPKVSETLRCSFIATGSDDVVQCDQQAVEGENFCQAHLDQIAAAEGAAVPA